MKKNVYESPEALVIRLESIDVVTASQFSDGNMIPDGWVES